MLKKLAVLGLVPVLFAGCGGGADDASVEGMTVFVGARVIDGNGGDPIENAVLVIRDDRIVSVGSAESVAVPDGATVVDLSGKTIMPPLIGVHMHLAMTDGLVNDASNFNEDNVRFKLNQYARYGVLHVNSMGTDQILVDELRIRQAAGEIPGARLYSAGRGFGVGSGGYPPQQPNATPDADVYRLTSVDQVPAAIAELAQRNVSFVKLWVDHHFHTRTAFDPVIYQAIVREALSAGMRPVAHIHTYEDADRLIDAGVVGIVHSVRDRPVDAALIQKYVGGNIFSVSTLAREESMFIYAGRAPYLDDPFFTAHLTPEIISTLESAAFQANHINNPELGEWRPALATAQQNLVALFNAGVKIGLGSDSGPPARFEGYFEHREMELMQEAGLTPAQIIQIATRNSAEILGIDRDYGTLAAGKSAEFLVLGANPQDNISNTKSLEQVWQNGVQIF